jgi:DNA-binding CsgD family transcriptional regulator
LALSNAWPFGFVFLIMWRVLIVRQNTVDHGGIDTHLLFYGSFGVVALFVALGAAFSGRKGPGAQKARGGQGIQSGRQDQDGLIIRGNRQERDVPKIQGNRQGQVTQQAIPGTPLPIDGKDTEASSLARALSSLGQGRSAALRGRLGRKARLVALCGCCIACMVASSCLLTLESFSGSPAAALTGAVLGGLATMVGMLGWGCFLKELPTLSSITYILVAYMAEFLLMPLFLMLAPLAAALVLLLLSVCAPLCLMAAQWTLTAGGDGTADGCIEIGRRGRRNQSGRTSLGEKGCLSADPLKQGKAQSPKAEDGGMDGRQTALSLWRLLLAFSIYSFVLTLRRPWASHSDDAVFFALSYLAMAATFLLFWALVVRRSCLPFERILQLLFLSFAAGFFFSPFSDGLAAEALADLLFSLTGLIFMLVWLAVVDMAHASEVSPLAIIGAWGACYGCPRLLFFLIDALLTRLGHDINTTVVASLLSLFGLFISFFLISHRTAGARPFLEGICGPHPLAKGSDPSALADWNALAHEHRLTERESEIFLLMCKGHTKRYIAEHLYISENTVKAHQKRIYTKMGVHSKLDLEGIIWPG